METRFYHLNDMVRADCHDCRGCSACCREMGDSILLDPYDAYQFQKKGMPVQTLIDSGAVALTVWRGMILPHLKMSEETGACPFLSAEGRCGIHTFRPGICRLFPLGRNFADGKLNYFLLENACENHSRSKIRVSRWLGIEPADDYHEFVIKWHDFRRDMVDILSGAAEDQAKQLNLYLLHIFFLNPYELESDFYTQFAGRIDRITDAFR